MKVSEMVLCVMAVLLVTFTFGNGAPQWRPQGRFGKRIDPALSILLHRGATKPYIPHEPAFLQEDKDYIPHLTDEISIEGLNGVMRDNLSKFLQRLCSESGLDNIPKCSWARKTDEGDEHLRLL